MKKRLICLFLIVCLVPFCWGCEKTPGPGSTTVTVPGGTTDSGGPVSVPTGPEGSPQPETKEMNTAPETFPYPSENIRPAYVEMFGAAASGSNGYYSGNKALKYTDMDSGKTIWLCPQPGCTHQDETCQAWIGSRVSYLCDYRGTLYAITEDGNGGYLFLTKDPATGERKVLEHWESENEYQYYSNVALGIFADGKCTIFVQKRYIDPEGDSWEEAHTYIYDLASGTREELPSEYSGTAWGVVGIYGDLLLLFYMDERLTEEEYIKYGYEQTYGSYEEYLKNYIPSQIRLYNRKTGEAKTIASEEDGLVFTVDPAVNYGYTFIYQKGNDICLYDLQTQEERVAVTMERVINFWLLDHKIFLIQSFNGKPDSGFYIYFMDMDGGPLYLLPNGGSTEGMEYSILYEGDDFFIGNYHGGKSVISKADFYADRYDQSRAGGY